MATEPVKKREHIAAMFNSIASRYDLLNFILSFGIDSIWRRKLTRFILKNRPGKILDIACGTGDLTIYFGKKGIPTTGVDISEKMVEVAIHKADKLSCKPDFVIASADELPFEKSSFDAVTISFGIRNFENRERALKEIYRVLTPGGVVAILEFAIPGNMVWRALYGFYLKRLIPITGMMITGNKHAYSYLADSIETFPRYEAFCREIEGAGFEKAEYLSLSGGIAVLYTAIKKT
jgi:demethylmenaquinone methyltransferase/2-methoxy-6-polyprenyl-1,4-benzoquinol methylase